MIADGKLIVLFPEDKVTPPEEPDGLHSFIGVDYENFCRADLVLYRKENGENIILKNRYGCKGKIKCK